MHLKRMPIVAVVVNFLLLGGRIAHAAPSDWSPRSQQVSEDRNARLTVDFVRQLFRAVHPVTKPGTLPNATAPERHSVLLPGSVSSLTDERDFLRPGLPSPSPLATVELPKSAEGPLGVTDTRSGRRMEVRWIDAIPAAPQLAAGIVVYNGAVRGGAWLHRVTEAGIEDFVLFGSLADTSNVLRYRVRPGPGLVGLRLVANTLELLDSSGEPKLRASPPWLIDATGAVRHARLDVVDCGVDTNPAAPWGRPVTDPGGAECTIEVRWDGSGLVYPILVDPSWSSTGSMATPRTFHTAKNVGTRVVVAGGYDSVSGSILNSAELYCITGSGCTQGTWAATGSMSAARFGHSAIAYDELSGGGSPYMSGTKMVVGGISSSFSYLSSCETYSVSAGSWSAGPTMSTARALPALARYDTGKFLAAGGENSSGGLSSVEGLTWGGSWTSLASMGTARRYHTATTLFPVYPTYDANQTPVLVAGGMDSNGNAIGLARRYDPTNNWWVDAGTMDTAVYYHTATQVLAGSYQYDVFVGGGDNGSGPQRLVQRYDRAAASWSTPSTIGDWRHSHSATLLGDNQTVLFVAGMGASGAELANAYSYDTNAGSGSSSNMPSGSARQFHTANLIGTSPSKVLIAGGHSNSTSLATALIYSH